mmetsp:Transcript_74998/g.138195  ORF Transcript_74998/g.138195 Transcript_74998/m.138195 type:complete len:266 (-) Transcript_74998:234-1031(-)
MAPFSVRAPSSARTFLILLSSSCLSTSLVSDSRTARTEVPLPLRNTSHRRVSSDKSMATSAARTPHEEATPATTWLSSSSLPLPDTKLITGASKRTRAPGSEASRTLRTCWCSRNDARRSSCGTSAPVRTFRKDAFVSLLSASKRTDKSSVTASLSRKMSSSLCIDANLLARLSNSALTCACSSGTVVDLVSISELATSCKDLSRALRNLLELSLALSICSFTNSRNFSVTTLALSSMNNFKVLLCSLITCTNSSSFFSFFSVSS